MCVWVCSHVFFQRRDAILPTSYCYIGQHWIPLCGKLATSLCRYIGTNKQRAEVFACLLYVRTMSLLLSRLILALGSTNNVDTAFSSLSLLLSGFERERERGPAGLIAFSSPSMDSNYLAKWTLQLLLHFKV